MSSHGVGGGGGGGVRVKFPAVERVMHSIPGFNSQSNKVDKSEWAKAIERLFSHAHTLSQMFWHVNALRKSISQDTVTKLKQ